jgi:tetratricopeptide (TPR) repeat protein
MVMANLCSDDQRYDEAEALYREILAKDPKQASSLNNLAFLLANRQTKIDEALQLINRAMEISGPMASMLDTRALVYLADNQPDKALADLDVALADIDVTSPTNGPPPVRLFHQARAYQQAGKTAEATDALLRAQKLGLKPEKLDAVERPLYMKLRDDLRI